MLFLNHASAKLTRHRPAALAAVVIAMAALLTALPASAQTAPVANDDSYPSAAGSDLMITAPGVLANDTDADGDPLTAVLETGPTDGTLSLRADGSFIYTPVTSPFPGTDSFTYRASDGSLTSAPATVTITEVYSANTVLEAGCVNESNGLLNVCTANDLTFVELGLGVQSDGCVNPADRLTIVMRGVLANTTSQTRYDAGMWFPLPDPAAPNPDYPALSPWQYIIDPEGDGAYTGVCGSIGFMNPEPWDPLDATTPTELCWFDLPTAGALDLAGNFYGLEFGHGPWVNDDGKTDYDSCGDLFDDGHNPGCDQDSDSAWDDSVIIFDSPLTLDCNDADFSTGSAVYDGFVSTPVCLTWGNQPGQVDDTGNGLCDDQSELQPGTKSKCRCEEYQLTNIPAPDLGLTCSMPAGVTEMRPGGFVQVSITYTNSCDCTEEVATAERFRCCTASYVQFPIYYDASKGFVDTIVAGSGIAEDDGTGTITWTPASPAPLSTSGVIPKLGSETLTFYYHDTAGQSGLTDIVTVAATWSDANEIDIDGVFTIDPRDQATLGTPCSIFFNPTWATISNVTAEIRDARTVVSWESSAEVGTVGYNVLRAGPDGDQWTEVNQHLLPAIGDGPGGRYQFVDDSAPTEGTVTYKVVEVDAWGRAQETQPVTVELREGDGEGPRSQFVTEHRQPSARMVENIERSRQQARHTKETTAVRRSPAKAGTKPDQPTHVKIGVSETGLYRVSAAAIAAALGETETKIGKRIGQHKLALTTGGQPVAWRAGADFSGILFFGQAPESIYDAERYYVLRAERGLEIEEAKGIAPQPAAVRGSFYDKVTAEEDLLMRPFNVADDGQDFWFWAGVLAGDPDFGEQRLEIDLEDVAEVNASARVRLSFVGFAPGDDVSASVFVNGSYVGDLYGPILASTEAEFEFSQANLISGPNTVHVVGRHGGVFIDRIEFEYERDLHTSADELTVRSPVQEIVSIDGFSTFDVGVYDISDRLRPMLLASGAATAADGSSIVVSFEPPTADGSYLAVGSGAIRQPTSVVGRAKADLRVSAHGAEYLIITTAELASTADRLAAYRQGNGLEAMVVDVEDIFDDFVFGARDPGAINAFLTFAADHWTTPPRYVLLAGRGHYDYKDLMGYGGNLLPPMLAATNRGLVPSDNIIADLDGDGLPDLAIGRLPVLNAGELNAAIDKIIAYENEPTGDWAKRVLLAADDPDKAGDFFKSSDTLALVMPSDREVEKVYLFDPYLASEVNDLMVAALEEGIGIVNWTGHAGLDTLANERVLTIADLAGLEGTAHPSVFVGLTCLLNNFGFPYFAAFGEELALLPGGGAIGVWAASGLSDNSQAERLGEKFMAALGGDEPRRLGDMILSANEEFSGPDADRDLVNQYVLFADPALVLK